MIFEKPDLSVVVLGYGAEEALPDFVSALIEKLETARIQSFQIIIVANFHDTLPKDRTPEIAQDLASRDGRIKVVARPKQGMMGWDARTGLAAADGSLIALIDGDGQMPPEDIIRAYKVMLTGEFDFVKTYRVTRGDGAVRLLTSKGFNILFKLFFPRSQFRDINSKPKFFSRDALRQMRLTCDGWFLDGEIMLEVHRLRLVYAEIPTHFKNNEWRGSFVRASTVLEMIKSMVTHRLRLLKK